MPVWRSVARIASPTVGGTGTNTWHFRTAGAGGGVPDADALAGATDYLMLFYQNLTTLFAAGTVISHDGLWTRVDDESGDQIDTDGWSAAMTGNDPLPPQLCMVIGWRAGTGGRTGRGRTFIGPLAKSTLEVNGTPEETSRNTMNAAAAAMINDFSGDTGDGAFCIWSEKAHLGRDFQSGSVRNVFGTLRSRRD